MKQAFVLDLSHAACYNLHRRSSMPIKEKQAMLDFIWTLMGKYAYQFIVQGIAVIQPIATTLLLPSPCSAKSIMLCA